MARATRTIGPPVEPADDELAYDRTVRTTVRLVAEDRFRVRATLQDDTWAPGGFQRIHDMAMEVELSRPELTILAVDGSMAAHPHGTCPGTLAGLDRLVGMRVQGGFFSELRGVLGGDRSCNHLHTMAQQVATVSALSYAAALAMTTDGLVDLPRDDFFRTVREREPGVVGSCHIWRPDGELVARLDRQDG